MIRWVRRVRVRSAPGARSRRAAVHSPAPLASAQVISNTEASKLLDANCSTRSSGLGVSTSCCARTRFSIPRWVTATPLGVPVEPEV